MKYKILIVDDEEAARFGIRKALTGRDNILLEAGTLQAARALLEAEQPDVLLLDVNLPDGLGTDLLKLCSRMTLNFTSMSFVLE